MRNQELSAYVMYRMAGVVHQKQGDDLSLPETPRPQPLRALFPVGADTWNDSQKSAAMKISEDNAWRDCIETIVASADGFPLDEPRQENGKFIFSGKAKSTPRIVHEIFLRRLGEWPPIDGELELEIRNALKFVRKEDMEQA